MRTEEEDPDALGLPAVVSDRSSSSASASTRSIRSATCVDGPLRHDHRMAGGGLVPAGWSVPAGSLPAGAASPRGPKSQGPSLPPTRRPPARPAFAASWSGTARAQAERGPLRVRWGSAAQRSPAQRSACCARPPSARLGEVVHGGEAERDGGGGLEVRIGRLHRLQLGAQPDGVDAQLLEEPCRKRGVGLRRVGRAARG